MDFQGKVIQFIGEKSGTSKAGNPWKKKEWVVETIGQYPRKVKLQCFGDRADLMNLEPGRDYTLYVDLESREFNGNWYTDVSVYRAEEITGQPQQFSGQVQSGYQSQSGSQAPSSFGGAPFSSTGGFGTEMQSDNSEEDLPF